MNIIKALLPFGLVNNPNIKIKKLIKKFLPYGLIVAVSNNKLSDPVKYLKENDVSDLTANEKWSILAILLYLERRQKHVEYLEVGIYAGGTIKFLKRKTNSTEFTGIDLFEDFKPSQDNTHLWTNYTQAQIWEALGKDRVTLIKGYSKDCLNNLQKQNKKYDLIFIDGNHTYNATKEDFDESIQMLKTGGYVAFHNCSTGISDEDKHYLELDGGPWMVAHELLMNDHYKLVTAIDRIQIFKKIS